MSPYLIRRNHLREDTQACIKRYILDHRLQPGDALPGETELRREIGVSRPTYREAITVLETIGVVDVRHGAGTYVGSLSLDPLADGIAFQILLAAQTSASIPPDLLDLIDLRQTLEMAQMRRVVGAHRPEQIGAMRALLAEMRELHRRSDRFGARDLALHLAFYEPLNNHVFDEFLRLLDGQQRHHPPARPAPPEVLLASTSASSRRFAATRCPRRRPPRAGPPRHWVHHPDGRSPGPTLIPVTMPARARRNPSAREPTRSRPTRCRGPRTRLASCGQGSSRAAGGPVGRRGGGTVVRGCAPGG